MNPERNPAAVGCEFSRFQFKLFANNGTKFGAPGNRTPLHTLQILTIYIADWCLD